MMRRAVLLSVVLSLAVGLLAAQASAALRPIERLDRALTRLTDDVRGGPPGASVLLRKGKRETFLRAGVADVRTKARFTRNKRMRIASTAKAFSGAVALSLVEKGLLSLDDTIAARLPGLSAAWGSVTLRQLLSHTGGVPNYTTDPGFQEYFRNNLQSTSITIRELVDFVADEPLRYPPGTSYEYSNTDNLVIALFAEAATGMSYTQLLEREVFARLGLRRTSLPLGSGLPAPRITGYELFPTENVTRCCAMAFVSASGGLISTPRELTRFTRGYVSGELFGGAPRAAQYQFVPGASSQPPGPGRNSGGLALFRYQTRCGTVYGHSGNFPGYTQFTASTRSGRRSLTFSVNRQIAPDAPGRFAPEAFKVLRRDYALAVCALLR